MANLFLGFDTNESGKVSFREVDDVNRCRSGDDGQYDEEPGGDDEGNCPALDALGLNFKGDGEWCGWSTVFKKFIITNVVSSLSAYVMESWQHSFAKYVPCNIMVEISIFLPLIFFYQSCQLEWMVIV